MTQLRIAIHSDLREHGDQAAVYRETLDLMVQTELFYASYAHRAEALDLFVREVAPALGWAGLPSLAG